MAEKKKSLVVIEPPLELPDGAETAEELFALKKRVEAVTVKQPRLPKVPSRYLRYAAGIYYTTDLSGCTLTDMGKHPIYKVIPQRTIYEWAEKDHWADRRKAVQEQWRVKVEAAMGSELARARVTQLESLERVYTQALTKLEDNLVEAKSWEGVATILVRIAELMDDWRGRLAQEIYPAMIGKVSSATALAKPRLNKDEARAAALTIIKRRWAEAEQREAAEREEAEGKIERQPVKRKKRPPVRVVGEGDAD